MKKIRIDKIIMKKRILSCCVCVEDTELQEEKMDVLQFEFSKKFVPSNESIATALVTLCGKTYAEVYIDLEIAKNVYDGINDFVGGNLKVKNITADRKFVKKQNFTLNFSGGFDSLAALLLMPHNTNLVSVDWGKGLNVKGDSMTNLVLMY